MVFRTVLCSRRRVRREPLLTRRMLAKTLTTRMGCTRRDNPAEKFCRKGGKRFCHTSQMGGRGIAIVFVASTFLGLTFGASPQTQTTGRIAGMVKDAQGAFIIGAQVSIENPATADKHSVTTHTAGNYSILQLPPGAYDVRISVPGFTPAVFHAVTIGLAETSIINASLQIAQSSVAVTVSDAPPVVRGDSPIRKLLIASRYLKPGVKRLLRCRYAWTNCRHRSGSPSSCIHTAGAGFVDGLGNG
jgi:hypothetical protein